MMKKMMKWVICLALTITMLAATAVGAMAEIYEITVDKNTPGNYTIDGNTVTITEYDFLDALLVATSHNGALRLSNLENFKLDDLKNIDLNTFAFGYKFYPSGSSDVVTDLSINLTVGFSGLKLNFDLDLPGDDKITLVADQQYVLQRRGVTKTGNALGITYPKEFGWVDNNDTFVIKVVDQRLSTQVVLNSGKTFTYSPTLNETAICDELFSAVTAEDGSSPDISGGKIEFSGLSTKVGTHTATCTYKGSADYKPSSAQVTYTVTKASAAITVNSQTKRYNEALSMPLFASFCKTESGNTSDNITTIEFAVGATMKGETFINLKFPVANFNILGISLPDQIKLGELTGLLQKIAPVLEGLDNNTLNTISSLINQLSDLVGTNLNNITINLKYKGDSVLPSKPAAGMYLIGAVTADPNYNTAANVGYVIITPDGTKVELGFNVHDANGLITKEKIDDGSYDLGSKVLTADQQNAEKNLRNLFIGVTEEGKLFVKDYKNGEKPSLPFGLYSQISYVKDWNNEMYYAVPIARSFAVVPRTVVVDVPNQQTFNYEKGIQRRAAVSVKLNGNELSDTLKNKNLTVVYTGVSADVSSYGPTTTPPSERGVYSVLATYVEYESGSRVPKYFGMDAGMMTIGKGQTTFDVNDAEVFYEKGVQHFPAVTNPENLPAIYVIRDQKGNVNILMPQGWNIGSGAYDVNDAVNAMLTALDTLPAHVRNQDAINALKDVLGKISIKKLSINDKKPEEIGTYSIIGIAYGSNYGALVDEGVLTIKEPILPGGGANDDVYDALDNLPKTGDNSELFVWIGMLFAAAAALMVFRRNKKVSE